MDFVNFKLNIGTYFVKQKLMFNTSSVITGY